MMRRLVSLATFSLLMSACAGAATLAPDSPADASAKQSASKADKLRVSEEQVEKAEARLAERRVGDYFAHRYSGSYRDTAVTLTEEVVEREGELLVIDYELEDGKQKTKLRVRLDPATDQVVRVSRMAGGQETEAELVDYEAMMQKTVFVPDYNEGRIARKKATCLVSGKEQECETSRYHVFVGDEPGTLIVTTSEALAGRDVSGMLKSADGDILYRSELLEMRRGKSEPNVGPRKAALRYVPDGL